MLGQDPEQARALGAEAYSDSRVRVSGQLDGFQFHQARRDLGEVQLDTFHNTLTTQYTMEPLQRLVVCRVLRGTLDIEVGREQRRVGTGEVVLIAPPDSPYRTRVHAAHLELVGVETTLLHRLIDADDLDPVAARVKRLTVEPLDPQAARRWQRVIDYVTEITGGGEDEVTHPLLLEEAGRLLAATLLSTFDRHGAPRERDDTGSAAVITRRAIAYMETNPDLELGAADIARAATASVRSMQLAFRRELDTTPMAYLRKVRLERVRGELARANSGSGATVTAIALRWGSRTTAGSWRSTAAPSECCPATRSAEPDGFVTVGAGFRKRSL